MGSAELKVRQVDFAFPDDLDPAWTPYQPELAAVANSVSLLMPHLEPYVVRCIERAIPDLEDDELADQAGLFVQQERRHHGEHHRFNRILINRYRALAPLDRLAGALFGWLGRKRSAASGLAFTAAFETFAYAAARWVAPRQRDLFFKADPAVAELFLWHLAEEVEHKSVAWDVNARAGGGRLRHLAAAVFCLLVMAGFVLAGTTAILWSERRLFHPATWLRLPWWGITFAFEVLEHLVLSLLPGHHPNQFVDPEFYRVWLLDRDLGSVTGRS
jgi:predicted metal-dependent hydrolase